MTDEQKPISDRLREWASAACPLNKAMSAYDIDLNSFDDEVSALFRYIADEIDKEAKGQGTMMAEQMTCGNCEYNAKCYGNSLFRGGTCLYMATGIDDANHPNCGGLYWKLTDNSTIEQRHQKLIQIAVDMWETIASDGYPSAIKRYREELEALGVRVDTSQ